MRKAIRISFTYSPDLPDKYFYPESFDKNTPIEHVMAFDKNELEVGNQSLENFLGDLTPIFEIVEVEDDNA